MKLLGCMFLAFASAVLLSGAPPQVPPTRPVPQTYGDRAAVEFATREYADAWKANDQKRVLATLLPDAVLMPSGLAPVSGTKAITRFWFPTDRPATRVLDIALTIEEVRLDGDLAVVSGSGTLTYTPITNNKPAAARTLRSWYINVLRRQPDGRWLIARRAWSDLR
jgi:uncharacterized protein (TIGR02246 family)